MSDEEPRPGAGPAHRPVEVTLLLVDAANVVGSVPDGWWRDRAGAAARLVERLRVAGLPYDVVVVLEGAARAGVEEGDHDGVVVVHAAGSGDDALVALAEAADSAVLLVSADRELGERVAALGAEVVGPRWLLAGGQQ